MLDEEFEGPETSDINDNNTYVFGRIGERTCEHNVVIGCFPDGRYGIGSAAAVSRDMVRSFPSLKFALMVGIGGGAPTPDRDIRLGDVVVSVPQGRLGGVIQYDFGKRLPDGRFLLTGQMNSPPEVLLGVIPEMRRRYNDPRKPDKILEYLKLMDDMPEYQRPAEDRLYRADYEHTGGITCASCATNGLEERPLRVTKRAVTVHYGIIASANSVMKNAEERNEYARDPELNALCFEMEAAGLMNNIPCLVIRGICDYSDSHKNDEWHNYAALAAAAYTRELLYILKPRKVTALPSWAGKFKDILSGLDTKVNQLSDGVQDMRFRQLNQEHQAILDWLTPVDYGTQQSDYLRKQQPGTGQWLLESKGYQAWLKTSKQTLFCPGIPGAGKTILTSIIINDLHKRYEDEVCIGVAYLYCSFQRRDEQTADDLLAGLLKQLSQESPSLPYSIKALYDQHKSKRTRPSFDEISRTLHSVVAKYSRVFFIIDALDECQTSNDCRKSFLTEIFKIQAKSGANIFAASRSIPEITEIFEGSIVQEIRASEDDVRRYLNSHMSRLPSFVSRNERLQEEIKAGIVQFLLAQLHLDSLIGKRSPKAIRTALAKLPTGSEAYDHAYQSAMERIKGQSSDQRKLAQEVLTWITCAKRPLKTSELQHALAVEISKSKLDEENLSQIEDMVSVCAGLVTVDDESDIIRLVHYTTQEYFDRTQAQWFPAAETDITKICVSYLSFSDFKTGFCKTNAEFEERLGLNPFYDYAAHNWGKHARKVQKCDQGVIDFLQDVKKVEASSQATMAVKISWDSKYKYSQDVPKKVTGLHLAAYFGIHEAVGSLLQPWQDVDLDDSYGQTPLSWAAQNGHEAVVQLLLEKGANIEAKDWDGCTPLLHAVDSGHETVVKVLLKNKADIETEDESGVTPLIGAVSRGHEAIVQLLLDNGADIQFKNIVGRTALFYAADVGHGGIVQLLTTCKDSLDVKDRDGRTPLSYAVESGQVAAVQVLLKKGADIKVKDGNGKTALSYAEESDHRAILKLLLEKGAKLESKDEEYDREQLMTALANGYEAIVNLLLEKVDNPGSIKDAAGDQILLWAAEIGLDTTVKVLLDKGAGIESTDTEFGRTPLALAAREGQEAVVKVLLTAGADLEHRDNNGRTPLSWAAQTGEEAVVRLLLEKCAVRDAKDKKGKTPLSYAKTSGYKKVVELLKVKK
ncbi:ankyrin repeat protein [Fusarium austroafricanum]|uniref:Ankyrin repeat protein n=1 Tax=Fusarium austroafricanum TaxID=2364996 RepID=A0A8H4JUC7_9HYPO|nr:ankyrin repeat protein [Fusarium austroafricanum]